MDSKALLTSIQHWLHLKTRASNEGSSEPPLPAELFNADQMERYGITLALSHSLRKKSTPDLLLARLTESEATLIQSSAFLAVKPADSFSPAREWLLDNFYLIQEQIHAIRRNLPKGYGKTLPQLDTALLGYPRVYDLALEIVEHGDGRWDLENLSRFIMAYQSVAKLTLGELWAIPITLGIALIENLSTASKRIVVDIHDRDLAKHWADRMIEVAITEPKKVVMIIADMARSEPPTTPAFVAELARHLQGAALALPLSWIEQRLSEEGLTIEQLIHEGNKIQAANQVTISNSIASLRRLTEVDWRNFVEKMSAVEQTLQQDPTATYGKMDFATRDRYRHVIERLSRRSKHSEWDVALFVIQLAQTKADSIEPAERNKPDNLRHSHVGYYLIDAGILQLESLLGINRSYRQRLVRFFSHFALLNYFGCIILITSVLMLTLLFKARQSGISEAWLWILGCGLAIYGSQMAVSLVNLVASLLVKPESLPRMDFTKGLPDTFRSLVVVPAMLSSAAGIEALVEALEVRFLGNQDKHLHFMLLTDFKDAPKEQMPEDEPLLALVKEKITALNERYPQEESDIFFLCHRSRQWNACENLWMGRERKRGKLTDLNNFLRGSPQPSFSLIIGRTEALTKVKYIITLDSDTELPRESARQFIGTMAHPLNRPRFDQKKQRVVEGYGILQPRVGEVIPIAGPSRYVQLSGSDPGIDPYTRTVSAIYQDVFHEGSFVGKGIYDVDLFQQVLGQRFPDNRILSHDLLEGCYLRSGFLSDVLLYEKSPSSYLADTKRRIRWIRGDWQLAGWLLPWVVNGDGRRVANPLSLLSRLKLGDNLRRSLVPLSLLLLLGLTWTILPPICFWFGITLTLVFLPLGIKTLLELLRKPRDMLLTQHIATSIQAACRNTGQVLLTLSCLPHEAWYSLSAILRTCWRILVTKKHLLEWTPSDQVDQGLQNSVTEWLRALWMGPLAALAATAVLMSKGSYELLFCAAPLLILWLISPFTMRWLSQPFHRFEPTLTFSQQRFLHRMARKTWSFFETFVRADNHWLPPDNYQERPIEALAKRTSPTNMGLTLLANLTAYDFGYINIDELLTRTKNTLQTMLGLERYRGHLYNWYSTETLEPLLPRYVSTVDSGNCVAHLLTLRQGLLSLPDEPLLNPVYLNGLEDTLELLTNSFNKAEPECLTQFRDLLLETRSAFSSWPEAQSCCRNLVALAEKIAATAAKSEGDKNGKVNESSEWSSKLVLACQALRDELSLFAEIPDLAPTVTLRELGNSGSALANERLRLIQSLAIQAFSLTQVDFNFLYDKDCHLMTIGFNVDTQWEDPSNYDLLSSEARLASFVAIAQGQVLQENWFALGRLLVSGGGKPVLISWSGSMFEYLMPLLVMPTYPDTLLDQSYQGAVSRQIAYGVKQGVPWGISESGYNAVDAQFNYLYRAFGVPSLGLKRGLEDDLVIAPYASAMALMVAPEAACQNLERLAAAKAIGRFGFYEAIDYTAARLPPDTKKILVRSFMTHHQGMSFLSFSYFLHQQPMQRRFLADPLIQSTVLLLQERIPKPTASYLQIPKAQTSSTVSNRPETSMRVFNTPNTRVPQVQLLSNGRYHLMLTQAGGGYSRWNDLAITRWREDSTSDDWGMFIYIRDLATGEFWSTSYQPTTLAPEHYKAVFSEAHAELTRHDGQLNVHTEIVVSPEDDIELRRVRIHNHNKTTRTIEFTSYAEIVLAPQAADQAQPAFSNLFIETELLPERQAILVTRRPQNEQQGTPWLCHLLNVYSDKPYTLSYETDRLRFIGRGHSKASPQALLLSGDLSNTMGAVLDPIVAIRCRIRIEPEAIITFDLLTGVADTRAECINLVDKYRDRSLANRIFGLAWTHGQVLLHQLNISEENAQLYGKLASSIIYTNNARRALPEVLASNRRGQSGLWSYSISGDLPIILLQIGDAANIELVQQLIQAQAYWKRKGLVVDLVIVNEEHVSYRQSLQDKIMGLITATLPTDHGGTIVVRLAEQLPPEDSILLQSAARVIFSDQRGTLKEQLGRRRLSPPLIPALSLSKIIPHVVNTKLPALPSDLQFFNGLGGFNSAGNEYLIRFSESKPTPAPWANVLANPQFGSLVSESGQAYTWIENAHEFRLTPWDNDPVTDSSGEAFYLRDEDSGHLWSPTALPCPGSGDYQTRHGFGYSVFEHIEDGISSELWIYVALDASIKFALLKIRNNSLRVRRLSVTGYVAWVLGDLRTRNAMHVVTELSDSGILMAQNHYNTEFGERTAFFDATTAVLGLSSRSVTGDRNEFLGRNGTLSKPAALKRKRLSGRVGAGLDPCAAIQLAFTLADGQSRDLVFTLGAGQNKQEAATLVARYQGITAAEAALAAIRQYWQETFSKFQVKTPDPALNLLANGWLLYQLLSSRLWGRSGYYQSAGAFGFRDQLQDVLALTQIGPEFLRAQILLCASHQFEAGDVQHWWHPPLNRGLRTRCSDDFLWLPFAICHYIETTGDRTILDEALPFLQGRPLKADEESYYELSTLGSEKVSLYQHALRAISNGLKFGSHGLPLMGSGDWNDGMNLVGVEGRGESVWLGFFLYDVLKRFARLATDYGDKTFAEHCEEESKKLQQQLEKNGWDGEWYRRAYFDDGTPLGSASNSECRIDSIAQSWSVLSGAADPLRAKKALAALKHYLVSEENNLVKLLDPPFDKSTPHPGYIEGYVPGIRENGGQYTHAAIWAAMAFAALDEKQVAWQLFHILNPINHGRNPTEIELYKIEPYVVAGDVYSVAPHIGCGGWSWYTGSAGWLYRLITETLLGVVLEEGKRLRLTPLLPEDWDGFSLDYCYGKTIYKITISRVSGKGGITLDGVELTENPLSLQDDGQVHHLTLNVASLP